MKPLLLLLLACTSPQSSEVAATSPTVTAIDEPILEASEHHIGFHLQFPERAGQYLQVTTVVPTQGRETVELAMATWTPGSYLIRDYSRHVERMTAQNDAGAPLNIRKTKKNRWVIETQSSTSVQVTYHLYADQLNVRGNWVEETFAVLNEVPPPFYMTPKI